MTREEHKAILSDVLANLSNQAHVSEQLTRLTEDYTQVTTDSESYKTTADKLKLDNDELIKSNSKLFLKIGNAITEDTKKTDTQTEQPSFDSLFDANGNLK